MHLHAKERWIYGLLFLLFLGIEVIIALFAHDAFIRPFLGDALVPLVIYPFLRIFIPQKIRLLPLWIFLFCFLVEGMQYFDVLTRLHLDNNTFLRILLGTSFDWRDVLCYAAGCLLLAGWEYIRYKFEPKSSGKR